MRSPSKDQLKRIVQSIKKYAEFFWDIAIQSHEIQKFKYSIQGLYAVLAAREVLGVKPIWNIQLDHFTCLHKEDTIKEIKEVTDILLLVFMIF